jgi:site-specific recombinase XerD
MCMGALAFHPRPPHLGQSQRCCVVASGHREGRTAYRYKNGHRKVSSLFPITRHYRKRPRRPKASGRARFFPNNRNCYDYRKENWESAGGLANGAEWGSIGHMRLEEKKTTTHTLALFAETLKGKNYSPESIKAYMGDLTQFFGWLQTRRVDWDIPYRLARIDIVAFINHLASQKATSGTRKRKLASIRGFLKFLKDNEIIYGNPADTIEGPIREERDPAILLKTEYKALLQVAGEYPRDFAMVMLCLQWGLRVSELVKLKLQDVDFASHEITVRQGKGRKDRVVPLVKQAEAALKAYLAVRDAQPEYDEVFIARNGTSMDVRTVRYRIHKYYQEAGIKKKASVHTLRHTFATHQIHNGLKINQLKEVLGHRKMETTYKYVHLDRTNLRQEMEQGAL